MIKPYLSDLVNENKAIENKFNEWNIQINVRVNFLSSNDTGEIRTIFVLSNMKKLGQVMKQMVLLKDLLVLS